MALLPKYVLRKGKITPKDRLLKMGGRGNHGHCLEIVVREGNGLDPFWVESLVGGFYEPGIPPKHCKANGELSVRVLRNT